MNRFYVMTIAARQIAAERQRAAERRKLVRYARRGRRAANPGPAG